VRHCHLSFHRLTLNRLYDDVVSGRISIVAKQLPTFFFPDGQKNDRTALARLFESNIMVKVWLYVWQCQC
jgi:hypothetical protein